MQAIITKYLGPTNSRGSRIKASCDVGSVTVSYHGEGGSDPHNVAVVALLKKLGWNCAFVSGELSNGDMCHVLTPIKGD